MENMMHIQREETRYENNEYANMPSVDYSTVSAPDLTTKTESRLDLAVIKEICDKYGFNYTFIYSTFCGNGSVFIVYHKTTLDVAEYENYSKNWGKLTQAQKETYWAIEHRYDDMYRRLHDCMHELDERTDLFFECNWVGNVGIFGSHDVKRQTYRGASDLYGWKDILNRWSPLIHDTNSKLSKGIYVMGYTRHLKPQPQNSPALAEYEPTLLKMVRDLIGDKYTANFEEGKRNCDTTSYRALVVRRKRDNDYCGMMIIVRDFIGRYHIRCAAPLCGETYWEMDWENPSEDLERALDYII